MRLIDHTSLGVGNKGGRVNHSLTKMPYEYEMTVALGDIATAIKNMTEEIKLLRMEMDKHAKKSTDELKEEINQSTFRLVTAIEKLNQQNVFGFKNVEQSLDVQAEEGKKQAKEHDVQLLEKVNESTLQLIAAFERIGEKTVVAVNEVKEAHDMQAIEVRDFALHWQHREQTKDKQQTKRSQWDY